jgi:3-oxoacyl-[acyl-carrier protein] reductase
LRRAAGAGAFRPADGGDRRLPRGARPATMGLLLEIARGVFPMDLGIAGRKAIVCASSKGLGKACARALAEAGCFIVLNGRDAKTLEAAAHEIRAIGAEVVAVAGDVGEARVRKALIAACPAPDILVNNNGGPPPQHFRSVTRYDLLRGLEANMLTPIALAQAVLPGMAQRRFGRVINITSSSVRAPIAGLDVSSGARAGLTAFLASTARAVARDNVTINSIQPGAFDTDRIRTGLLKRAAERGIDEAQARAEREASIPAGRFGHADELGRLCAFLASAHAGYITGQNILIDGGAFPGVF